MNYTENLSLGLPEYGEDADVADLNRNSGILDAYCYNTRQIECEPYDSTKTYMSGDLSIHNEVIYECNTDNTTGAWDDSKWDSTTLAEQIAKAKQSGGESALADLEDVEITNPSTGQALLFDDDDDVWKNQNLPDVSVTKEASGNPIEITDAASAPMVKCVTEIQGSQDLHGYDKPWVGGAGKNKLPQTTTGTLTINGITFTPNDDGSVKVVGTATGIANYSYITTNASSPLKAGNWRTYASGLSNVRFVIGGSQSSITGITLLEDGYTDFTLANDNDTLGYCTIQVASGKTVNSTVYLMITSQNESSTFQPYSNICPITAYTEGEIEVSDGDGNVTTHTTTYPSAIYRGSEDVVNGEVTSDSGVLTENDFSSVQGTTSGGLHYVELTNLNSKADGFCLCNMAEKNNPGAWESTVPVVQNQVEGKIRFYGDFSTLSEFQTKFAGLQIVYEYKTPTTTSVTPTNLPIKSLNGYTHIESSTGDMEVEYITSEYQPLVDLIQSGNGHTYSTSEQVVGKWIDGSDLYERTFELSNPSQSGVISTGQTYDVAFLVSGYYVLDDGNSILSANQFLATSNFTYVHVEKDGDIQYRVNGYTATKLSVTIRYTKTTQTRSLNAPVTSQKAQIEPLTDKTEEVPTEEEKAVNEEENTNENR